MASLSGRGVAFYNGFTFPPDKTETTDLRITPIPDRSGRTFVEHRFSLTLRTLIANATASDPFVNQAVIALTQPGGALRYDGRGVGNIRVNLGAGTRDLRWGPIPKLIALKPKGGERAVELTWQVEWARTTCDDAADFGFPSEFVYTVSTDIDQSGYTRARVYTAILRIPQTRRTVDDRTVQMTADQFRERINPAPVPGFRRIPGVATLSEDRCELRLVVRDEQMGPNIPPPGVIAAEASHRISQEPGKLLYWSGQIEANYEMALGVPVSVAWDAFFALCRDRIPQPGGPGGPGRLASAAIAGATPPKPSGAMLVLGAQALTFLANPALGIATVAADFIGGKPANTPKKEILAVVPWQFSATEPQIYEKTRVGLSLGYRVIGATRDQILTQHGLWRPVPGSNWRNWFASIQSHVGPRGIAGIVFAPGEDRITDLCRPAVPIAPPAPQVQLQDAELRAGRPRPRTAELRTDNPLRLGELFSVPKPANSYLDYVVGLMTETDSGTIISSTLPKIPLSTATRSQTTSGAGLRLIGETVAHQRVRATVYLTLIGRAMRVGYPVPVPQIESINGQSPVLCNRPDRGEGFWQGVVGNAGLGMPIYQAEWRHRYALVGPLTGDVPVPVNPLLT